MDILQNTLLAPLLFLVSNVLGVQYNFRAFNGALVFNKPKPYNYFLKVSLL